MAEEKKVEKAAEMDLLAPEPGDADSVFGAYVGDSGEGEIKDEPQVTSTDEKQPPDEKKPQKDEVKEPEKPVSEKVKEAEPKEPQDEPASEPDLEATVREAVKGYLAESAKEDKPQVPPAEDWQKRYYDTQRWSTQVQQENRGLKQRLAGIETRLGEANKKMREEGVEFEATMPHQEVSPPLYPAPPLQVGYPPIQPQTFGPQPEADPRQGASPFSADGWLGRALDSADKLFGRVVVDEYLLPGTGKFDKMVAEVGPSAGVDLSRSLDPCVEAIRKTKEWELAKGGNGDKMVDDKMVDDKMVDDIISRIMQKIGVGKQPDGGGQKGNLPVGLDHVRSASGGKSKEKADIEAGPGDYFGQFVGQRE